MHEEGGARRKDHGEEAMKNSLKMMNIYIYIYSGWGLLGQK